MTSVKTRGAFYLGLALALATPAFAGAQVQGDYLIVPDSRIGAISLGMSDKDLFKLGIPIQTAPLGANTLYRYPDITITVVNSTHQVASVMVQNNRKYHTADGVHVGSTIRDVEASNGPPEEFGGTPGPQPDGVFYRSHRLVFYFSPENSSLADRPTTTVQWIGIETANAHNF